MNILATYHPADKDYGHMKVDEPRTPYYRLPDSDEDLSPESSSPMTPEMLTERLAKMDSSYPKVLRYGDNRKPESPDDFSKTHSSDFEKRRKAHYDEGKFFKALKNMPLDNKKSRESNISMDSSNQGVMSHGSEPRSTERDWAGGLNRGVRDRGILMAKNHSLKNKDSSTFRNQPLEISTDLPQKQFELKRKEYYSKGRYLRSCAYPELEEDSEDQQQDYESLQLQRTKKEEGRKWKL